MSDITNFLLTMSVLGISILIAITLVELKKRYTANKTQEVVQGLAAVVSAAFPGMTHNAQTPNPFLSMITTSPKRRSSEVIWTVINKSHTHVVANDTKVLAGSTASVSAKKDSALCCSDLSVIPTSGATAVIHNGLAVSITHTSATTLSIVIRTDAYHGVCLEAYGAEDTLKAVTLAGALVPIGKQSLTDVSHVLTPAGKKIRFRSADAGVTDGYTWKVARLSVNSVRLEAKAVGK